MHVIMLLWQNHSLEEGTFTSSASSTQSCFNLFAIDIDLKPCNEYRFSFQTQKPFLKVFEATGYFIID